MGPQPLPHSRVPSRNTFFIKTLLFILTVVVLFYMYFSETLKWTNQKVQFPPLYPKNMHLKQEPELKLNGIGAPFKEMSVDVIMRSILDSLPKAGNFSSIKSSSSGQHSVVNLEQPRAQYCVGDTLNVQVNVRDYRGNSKAYGGDFILARIHSPKLQASASGQVTDQLNGSYHVRFHLFWPGDVLVSVILVHSSEAVGILRRISAHNYNKIIYTGTFYRGKRKEQSQCAMRVKADKPLCEYRKKENAEYFACVRPRTLPCSTLRTMSSRNAPIFHMTKAEKSLLTWRHTGIPMRNCFGPVNVISCAARTHRPTQKCAAGFGMTSPLPTGYFFENRWFSSSCRTGSFFTADAIGRCLKGKRLKLMGDSTVRQWQFMLRGALKDLKFNDPDYHFFALGVDPKMNITVQWQMHGHPFTTRAKVVKDSCGYVSEELDKAAFSDVVVIGVGQHFRPFPLEVFIQRLINMRKAIVRLHKRSPQTPVVIKLENTREPTSTLTHLSDWFGYVQNLAQRQVFRDLNVVLVDAWDMTTAANTFAIHPNEIVVSNEISLALSHFCYDA